MLIAVADGEAIERDAAGGKRFGDVDPVQHLERVRMDDACTRGIQALLQGVDHQMVHTGLLKGGGEREAGGPGADDQDFSV